MDELRGRDATARSAASAARTGRTDTVLIRTISDIYFDLFAGARTRGAAEHRQHRGTRTYHG
jgi:hypothetical protein